MYILKCTAGLFGFLFPVLIFCAAGGVELDLAYALVIPSGICWLSLLGS